MAETQAPATLGEPIEVTPHAFGIGIKTAFARTRPVGEIPQRYRSTEYRQLFLDTDNLREWDHGIFQRFPQAEKVQVMFLR